MKNEELNKIGKWLNSKGFDIDVTDCFWLDDWIANQATFRDLASLLNEYHAEQLNLASIKLCDLLEQKLATIKLIDEFLIKPEVQGLVRSDFEKEADEVNAHIKLLRYLINN